MFEYLTKMYIYPIWNFDFSSLVWNEIQSLLKSVEVYNLIDGKFQFKVQCPE